MKKLVIPLALMLLLVSCVTAVSTVKTELGGTMTIYDMNNWWDRFVFSLKGQDQGQWVQGQWILPTPSSANIGETVNVGFQVPFTCISPGTPKTAKVSFLEADIVKDYASTAIDQYDCSDGPVGANWMVNYVIPSSTDVSKTHGFKVQIFDTNSKVIGTEQVPYIIKGATSCQSNYCDDWSIYSSSLDNGHFEYKHCYTFGSPPLCTMSSTIEYKTVCNSGYVCSGTTSQTCSGLSHTCELVGVPTCTTGDKRCTTTSIYSYQICSGGSWIQYTCPNLGTCSGDGVCSGGTGTCAYTTSTCPSWSTCSGTSQYCTEPNCASVTKSCGTTGGLKVINLIIPSTIAINQPTIDNIKITVKNEGAVKAHAFFRLAVYTEEYATQQGYNNNLLQAMISLYGTGTGCDAKELWASWGEIDVDPGEETDLFSETSGTNVYPSLFVPNQNSKLSDGTSNYAADGKYMIVAGLYTDTATCAFDSVVSRKIEVTGKTKPCETVQDCNEGEACDPINKICYAASDKALCGQSCDLVGGVSGPQSSCLSGWCFSAPWSLSNLITSTNYCEPTGFDATAFKSLTNDQQSQVKAGMCASYYWTVNPTPPITCPGTFSKECIPEGCTYSDDPLVSSQTCCAGLVKHEESKQVFGLVKTGTCIKPSTDICSSLEGLNFIGVECGGAYVLVGGVIGGLTILMLVMSMMKGSGGGGFYGLPPVRKYRHYLIGAILSIIILYLAQTKGYISLESQQLLIVGAILAIGIGYALKEYKHKLPSMIRRYI